MVIAGIKMGWIINEKGQRVHRFEKGNNDGKGRPLGSKNQIGNIRARILRVVQRRIFQERNLDTVSTTDLLKFLASIMPKEMGVSVSTPQVTYISNIPRPQLEEKVASVIENKTVNIALSESVKDGNGDSLDDETVDVHGDKVHPQDT